MGDVLKDGANGGEVHVMAASALRIHEADEGQAHLFLSI